MKKQPVAARDEVEMRGGCGGGQLHRADLMVSVLRGMGENVPMSYHRHHTYYVFPKVLLIVEKR